MPPDGDDPILPGQHGGDLLPEDVPIEDDSSDPLDGDNQPDCNTGLTGPDPDDEDDQEYIIPADHGPPPDDDLDRHPHHLGPHPTHHLGPHLLILLQNPNESEWWAGCRGGKL